MKKRIAKILFFISFAPALILIFMGIYHSIFGYDVYTMILPTYVRTIYGFEAFMEIIVWYGFAFVLIPVLPCCFIYQIVYLWIVLRKRKKDRF